MTVEDEVLAELKRLRYQAVTEQVRLAKTDRINRPQQLIGQLQIIDHLMDFIDPLGDHAMHSATTTEPKETP